MPPTIPNYQRSTYTDNKLYNSSIFVHESWEPVFTDSIISEFNEIKQSFLDLFGSYKDPLTQMYFIRQGPADTKVYLHCLFQNVFEPFRHCIFPELRCVILIDSPYHRQWSLSGMPLIVQQDAIKKLNEEGIAFEKLVRNYYNVQDYSPNINPITLLGQGCLIVYSRPLATSQQISDNAILQVQDRMRDLTLSILKSVCSKRVVYNSSILPILKIGKFARIHNTLSEEFDIPHTLIEGFHDHDIMSEIIMASPLEKINNFLSTNKISLLEW